MILGSKSLLPWLLLGSLIFFIFFIFFQSSSPPFRIKELKQRFNGGWKPGCDLSNGSWVRDTGSSHGYTNQTCKSLPESKNCGKYGKKGDYDRWRWEPAGCKLPRFNAIEFLEICRGKRLAFIGDSVARNQADSLICFLSEVRLAISCPSGKTRRCQSPKCGRILDTEEVAKTKNPAGDPPPLRSPPFFASYEWSCNSVAARPRYIQGRRTPSSRSRRQGKGTISTEGDLEGQMRSMKRD